MAIFSLFHWELDELDAYAFVQQGTRAEEQLRRDHPGAVMVWSVDAVSYNDAMRRYHVHMGLEPYQPRLDPDGREYPEDEAPLS